MRQLHRTRTTTSDLHRPVDLTNSEVYRAVACRPITRYEVTGGYLNLPGLTACGACGCATCAEFLRATKTLRQDSAALEFTGPVCNLRDIDLGIAVGSAAKTAAIHSIDCRCQARVAVAARKLGLIQADHAVALSLSMTHKAVAELLADFAIRPGLPARSR